MLNIIYFLLIGLIAGWLAGKFMKGRSFGIGKSMVVGIIGALLGGFLLGLIGFNSYGLIADLITAFLGAVVLLLIVRALS